MDRPDPRPARQPDEPHPELAEERLMGESVYEGRLLHVHRDWVRAPDGHEQAFEYTLHPGAAAVIPILEDGRLVMERQWRYAMNRSFLEFPAGKLHTGEDPLLAIQRELIEETGYRAQQWARLGV
ncbi:MAG: NUDIX hydrolase, partial [Betaproteobacteria bacterium]|nr:NUDIX hydrolase [Betaproteobacteria bacterium]